MVLDRVLQPRKLFDNQKNINPKKNDEKINS
jgi:hypothetical protein